MMAAKKKPELQIITGAGKAGRRREPIEKRKMLSDNPHKNRKGPKDIESAVISPEELPVKPPKKLSKFEQECWDMIVLTQTGKNSRWIYRSDCSHLIATCILYGRLMEVRDEINVLRDAGAGILEADSMRANPLYALEAQLVVKFQSSLRELGLTPTSRMITLKPDEPEGDGLLR